MKLDIEAGFTYDINVNGAKVVRLRNRSTSAGTVKIDAPGATGSTSYNPSSETWDTSALGYIELLPGDEVYLNFSTADLPYVIFIGADDASNSLLDIWPYSTSIYKVD